MRLQKIRKLLTFLVAAILSLALLAGCNTSTISTNTKSSGSTTTGSQTNVTTVSPTESNQATPAASAETNITAAPASATPNIIKDDTDGDGIPDAIEKTYGTNPHAYDTDGDGQNDKDDTNPVFADNPISETASTVLPIKIDDVRVEDNATADHLEITMTNTGAAELSSFDIYYTITDKVDGKKEAYYQKLDGLVLQAGEKKTIHFDNLQQGNHYFGNMNGLYGTSKNGLLFNIQLHSAGFKPLDFTVEKAKGTAEVAD